MSGAATQPSAPNSSRPSGAGVRGQTARVAPLDHRPAGDGAGALAAAFKDGIDLLAGQLRAPLAERRESLDYALGEEPFLLLATDLRPSAEFPVVLPVVEEKLIERADIAGSRVAGIRFAGPLHVGDHAHDLLPNYVGWVGDSDDVLEALRHLCLPIGAFDDGGVGIQDKLRLGEHRAIGAVEAASDLTRELDVGSLVSTHRHDVAFDDDDVSALEYRVLEESEVHVVRLVAHLFFKRRHALHPAERRHHREE